ncbi:Lsr2 protein [Friedmanniella luteola]|uniref:Lsr2 protein n=1 Tax=Friedmanniella luteola TaxID=546871 RepID=A0A1H1RHZ3_9ACTN|nr:helix-turn-helix domain-containing protein [Friedmanniella luteola]SDS35351.1 Lsr2 protein [Friedmanniella luteola]
MVGRQAAAVRFDDLDSTVLDDERGKVCFALEDVDYENELSTTHQDQFHVGIEPSSDSAGVVDQAEETRTDRRRRDKPVIPPEGHHQIDELVRRYQAGASMRALAIEQGLSRGTIRRLLLAAGVQLRQQRQLPADPIWWAARIGGGRTDEEVAAELQVHPYTVARHLRNAGLRQPADRGEQPFAEWLKARTAADGACLRWIGGHTSSGYGEGRYQGANVWPTGSSGNTTTERSPTATSSPAPPTAPTPIASILHTCNP